MEQPKVYSYSRFSSSDQAKGHSLERQLQRAREWCVKWSLTLETEISDEGLSAFHADHLKTGALGKFLAQVEAGRIPAGSILLVEQLDRLSRLSLHQSQNLLWRILDHGIRVVTLVDDKEYTKDQGIGAVIGMLVTLEASHQESAKKSDRLKESWKKRAEKAEAGQVISKRLPGWLEVKDGKIVVIPEKEKTLKEMFTWASEGMGITAIAGRLNKRKEPTWGPSRSWRRTVIYQILVNPSATGTLSLKMEGGTREIEGYFPPVIDKSLFKQVKRSLSEKTFSGGSSRAGRNAGYTNLFSGIGFCTSCGARMAIINAGKKNGGHRLVCDDARLGRGCKYISIKYHPVEKAILEYCNEIDISKLTGGTQEPAIKAARVEVQTLKMSLEEKQSQVESQLLLSSNVKSPELIQLLAAKLDSLQRGINDTREKLEEAERKAERLSRSGNILIERLEAVRKLQVEMQESDKDKLIETRRKLRVVLSEAIERIDFYPEGLGNKIPVFRDNGIKIIEYGEYFDSLPADTKALDEIIKERNSGKENMSFLVKFYNGHSRLFKLSKDKEQFVQTMVGTKEYQEFTFIGEYVRYNKNTGKNFNSPMKNDVEKNAEDEINPEDYMEQ